MEFHFTALIEVDDETDLWHAIYYKMPFRNDLISIMKRCGCVPESSMESYVNTIEHRNRLEQRAKDQDLLLA